MSELLNGIFEYLDIDSYTGLATKNNMQSMNPFQRLFYTQVHEKIGIDASKEGVQIWRITVEQSTEYSHAK